MKKNKKASDIFSSVVAIVRHNFSIKLVCFVLALILYVLVAFSEQSEKTFVKKLQINGLREDLIISNSLPENIKIIVK